MPIVLVYDFVCFSLYNGCNFDAAVSVNLLFNYTRL